MSDEKKCCRECRFFEPKESARTHRGECRFYNYKILAVWPSSVRLKRYKVCATDGTDCPCFERKEK